MGVDSCVLLLLKGTGTRIPLWFLRGEIESSAIGKLDGSRLASREVRRCSSESKRDTKFITVLGYA
jgi:hypothetical protein